MIPPIESLLAQWDDHDRQITKSKREQEALLPHLIIAIAALAVQLGFNSAPASVKRGWVRFMSSTPPRSVFDVLVDLKRRGWTLSDFVFIARLQPSDPVLFLRPGFWN
jgi:hypothetical protein